MPITDDDLLRQLSDVERVARHLRERLPEIRALGERIRAAIAAGGKVLTCGNGGSAAEAAHLATELLGRYKSNRPALPAIALNADGSLLTCIGNDFGYDDLFARQVSGLGAPATCCSCLPRAATPETWSPRRRQHAPPASTRRRSWGRRAAACAGSVTGSCCSPSPRRRAFRRGT